MDWVSICLGLGIILQIFVNIRLISGLSNYIEEMLREIVEDLPPALGKAVGENMQNVEMGESTPIQLAIAQILPQLFQKPALEVTKIARGSDGKFQ